MTDIVTKSKPKRLSKSKRIHVRRVKHWELVGPPDKHLLSELRAQHRLVLAILAASVAGASDHAEPDPG